MRTLIFLLLAAFILGSMGVNSASAADKMTYEEYQAQLKAYQDREQNALESIEAERQTIADIEQENAELDAQIAALWDEIYALAGTNEEEYDQFQDEIAMLDGRISELERMSPDRLLENADELDELTEKLGSIKNENPAKISWVMEQLDNLSDRVERLKRALPKPKHDMYTVIRGDYLWKISGKQSIYNDSWKWMRIYSYNRGQISNPDLIYPDQRLTIPRQIGRDEHLVQRGEYLSKIAGYNEVYGDPFKWTKIYQANKSGGFIQDPNVIYPEQILTIPQD